MVKIVEIEIDDIATIKSIIEILNGTVPEANADFIRDARVFNENIDKQKNKLSNSDKSLSTTDPDQCENNDFDDTEDSLENTTIKQKLKSTKGTIPKITKNNIAVKKVIKKTESDTNDKKKTTKIENEELSKNNKKKTNDKLKRINQSKQKIKENDDKSNKSKKQVTKNYRNTENHDEDHSNEDTENSQIKEGNPGQIKILTADSNQVMIIYILLNGSAFKKFVVHPEKYSVGLNLDELYKYIKNVDKEGIMSIHIDSDDTQHIVFDVKSDNAATNESICELRVVNLPSRHDRKIEVDVTMVVRINCSAFHKACKDLMQFSQFVEITCDPSQLSITCKGDLSNHKRIFKVDGTQDGVMIKTVKRDEDNDETPDIIRLVFDLKYINSMYKCSSLCDDMEIYLNPESIMFLKYGIKLIGDMMVGIAPSRKKKEQADNYDENIDTFYRDDEEIQLI